MWLGRKALVPANDAPNKAQEAYASPESKVLMQKLEPIPTPMRTLAETRSLARPSSTSWGEYGVAKPIELGSPKAGSNLARNGLCWAEARIRGTSDFAPVFDGCKNTAREGFLTCRVHADRELAARELRCELDGLRLPDIAYLNAAEKEAGRVEQRNAILARLAARRAK